MFERLSNRDMKDKLIADERMKKFERDVLHWINYDYVCINDDLHECYKKYKNLLTLKLTMTQKIMIKNFIRKHVEKLTS